MLDSAYRNAGRRLRRRNPLYGKIIRFGSAAGKYYLSRMCAYRIRDLSARILNGLPRMPSKTVATGRVALRMLQKGQHGIKNTKVERSRGVVVEIYGRVAHGNAAGYPQAATA